MQVYRSLETPFPPDTALVLAVGMFDGLHRGHQAVIGKALDEARLRNALPGLLTFWPHPSAVLRPASRTLLFQPRALKEEKAAEFGMLAYIEQPFTQDFSAIQAEAFPLWLKDRLPGLQCLICGDNWRFGNRGRGDVSLLTQLAPGAGFTAIGLPRQSCGGEPISSSLIRRCLAEGELARANDLLGYAYAVEGTVCPGRQLGRTLGFPTLNLPWEVDLVPKPGVYAVHVSVDSPLERVPAIANLGFRPTVETSPERPLLEVHLLTSREPLPATGQRLRVHFHHFLRPEVRFPDLAALRKQIEQDVAVAKGLF